jgi:AcrR family transcriptional regulator
MDLKTKRKNELNAQKEKRKEEIIKIAIEVFSEKGIENTKMTDIAEKAEVGVASVYRYFKIKRELVIDAAIKMWEKVINDSYREFKTEEYEKLNGIQAVAKILSVFKDFYKNNKDFIKYIEEFDNYIVKEKVSPEKLEAYENNILNLMPVMFEALEKGKLDKTIKLSVTNEEFYMTITHALMSLCQKLISRNTILHSDDDIAGEAQVNLIIDMAIKYISN